MFSVFLLLILNKEMSVRLFFSNAVHLVAFQNSKIKLFPIWSRKKFHLWCLAGFWIHLWGLTFLNWLDFLSNIHLNTCSKSISKTLKSNHRHRSFVCNVGCSFYLPSVFPLLNLKLHFFLGLNKMDLFDGMVYISRRCISWIRCIQ